MILSPCKNFRKSEIKKGQLVMRVRPDFNIASLTYFGGYKGCKEYHFQAASETREISLAATDSPVLHKWSPEALPQIPYSTSERYGRFHEIYFGDPTDVLETLKHITTGDGSLISSDLLPNKGLCAVEE